MTFDFRLRKNHQFIDIRYFKIWTIYDWITNGWLSMPLSILMEDYTYERRYYNKIRGLPLLSGILANRPSTGWINQQGWLYKLVFPFSIVSFCLTERLHRYFNKKSWTFLFYLLEYLHAYVHFQEGRNYYERNRESSFCIFFSKVADWKM